MEKCSKIPQKEISRLNFAQVRILQKYFNLFKNKKSANEIENVSDILRVKIRKCFYNWLFLKHFYKITIMLHFTETY